MSQPREPGARKAPIFGQSHPLDDEEAQSITEMIREAQGSSRALSIPPEDLDAQATTQMDPPTARVVAESHVRDILQRFNRDYLYGLGRFDEYQHGLLLKWGDGYSRRHIWLIVEGDTLVFETSHERPCGKPFCYQGRHIYTPDQWRDLRLINDELADQFKHPIYERSDD